MNHMVAQKLLVNDVRKAEQLCDIQTSCSYRSAIDVHNYITD